MKTELRRFLEDEFQAIGEEMPAWEQEARDFWLHPDQFDLAVWVQRGGLRDILEPKDGTVSERVLYHRLMHMVKPAIEYRKLGFQNVPTLTGHCDLYEGLQPGPHFSAAVMGAEVIQPKDTPTGAGIPPAGYAHVKPMMTIDSVRESLPVLDNYDVSRSPVLQAVLQGLEQMYEITQGTVPFRHYAPADMASGLLGVTNLFMLMALDPELCLDFLRVCNRKRCQILELEERAINGRWANLFYEPGVICGAWDNELSPDSHRQVMLPLFADMAEMYGAITFHLGHSDTTLLRDYLSLPHVRACRINRDWPMKPVVEQLPGKAVLQLRCDEHLHAGEKPWNLVQRPWEQVLEKFSAVAARVRVQAYIGHHADTFEDHKKVNLQERDALWDIWHKKMGNNSAPVGGKLWVCQVKLM